MKATGIIRRVDDLGRVVIPKEIRRTMRIHEGDALEIYVDGDHIAFKPYKLPEANKAEFAQKWLENNAFSINHCGARFCIEERTVTCETIRSNKRVTTKAIAASEDTFAPAIGMVISFCRAMNWDIPAELRD